jgi:OOP family OmpA-OmpF porin
MISRLAMVVAATTLAACGGSQVAMNQSAFEKELVADYKPLAEYEAVQGDIIDAHFYRKRIKAIMVGETPNPTMVDTRNLPLEKVGELAEGRALLVKYLDSGAKKRMPEWAAEAQAKFDCWAEQQEENFQSEDINACRADFYEAMRHLAPAKVAKVVPVQHMKSAAAVYFDLDSSKLTSAAQRELKVVAEKIKGMAPSSIMLSGHADTSGTSMYNEKLSARRAETVSAYLRQQGVDTEMFKVNFAGEMDLPKPTADNTVEAANRVVNITLIK